MFIYIKKSIFLLVILTVAIHPQLHAQPSLPDAIINLWLRYNQAADDSSRIICLSRLASCYYNYLEDSQTADSLALAAIDIAMSNGRPELLATACNNYIEATENELRYDQAKKFAEMALQICRMTHNLPLRWRTYKNLATIHYSEGNGCIALQNSREALAVAKLLKNDTLIAASYLFIGKSQELVRQTMVAFRSYLTAREMAEKLGNPRLLIKCYTQMYEFYKENKLYNDALECNQRMRELIQEDSPVDSVALCWSQYYFQNILVLQRTTGLQEKEVKQVIDFAIRTRNFRLKKWEFSLYRTYLLGVDQLMTMYNFYTNSYPVEFEKLHKIDPGMYFRLMAYSKELGKQLDSADYYFVKAQQLIDRNPGKGKIYQGNFFNRYGQFLMRHGRGGEAIEKFLKAYNLFAADRYVGKYSYMLASSQNLEKLYRQAGDWHNAWFYAMANLRMTDSITFNSKKEQVMAEAVRQERLQKDKAAEKDRQKIRQGQNQRNMFAGGVVFFIIVTLLVYRNFRNQKRLNRLLDAAKKQSDHLLLNILPHETAEELKLTGKAKAQHFNEVTVMFTDFKDFTQASERMGAEELVAVIHFYFSEFDKIISKHNLEKIKIIGDSYMCAGGLPVANDTHAVDVVTAAVEFRKLILAQKEERSGRGEPFFELRIGIHTGPVVAGIVGLKKFAYDIWGDTVNTASRMETAGETNKVNISGTTYEKVKDKFTCIYRGKINAKHKGQIDMYFVS